MKKLLYPKNLFAIFLFALLYINFLFSVLYGQQPRSNYIAPSHVKFSTSNLLYLYAGSGFFNIGVMGWPGGENAFKGLLNGNSFLWGGIVDGQPIVNGGALSGSIQPGKLYDSGIPDNPNDSKYRVYKIKKGWETMPFGLQRDQLEKDFNEWPFDEGAPWFDVDGDGIFTRGIDRPDYIGDEVLFYIANDMGQLRPNFPNQRVGIEVQVLTWAFFNYGDLGDVIFQRYRLINKSMKIVDSMYIGFSTFFRVGNTTTNFAGADTNINMVYGYKRNNADFIYGSPPPAVGIQILQGPISPALQSDSAYFKSEWRKGFKNLGLTSFLLQYAMYLYDVSPTSPLSPSSSRGDLTKQYYNILSGVRWSGLPFGDPYTRKQTGIMLAGDPVTGTGWYEGDGWNVSRFDNLPPIHRSLTETRSGIWSIGSFTLAPFDTQEVVISYIAALGNDNLNSITELRRKARVIQQAYYKDFQIVDPPDPVELQYYPQNKKITLWWDSKSEEFEEIDLFLTEQNYADTTYSFEGYRIWQYSDADGNDPVLLDVYDINNSITTIEDFLIVNGIPVLVPVIHGKNNGLRRYLTINNDAYTNKPLQNGNHYYFGITAYAHSHYSFPRLLESKHRPVEVIPGKAKIDFSPVYSQWDHIPAAQITGKSDGYVELKVIDPEKLTGDEYEILFDTDGYRLTYGVINLTKGDTLYTGRTEISPDTLNKVVSDGFIVLHYDIGKQNVQSIPAGDRLSGIKEILEITGPGGKPLEEPIDVIYEYNSTNKWKITSLGPKPDPEQNINWIDNISVDNFEVRFTKEGSEYYTTGYSGLRPPLLDNPKGKGRVPFEIWNTGYDNNKNERLHVKVWDKELRDTAWTQDPQTTLWEYIFGYYDVEEYKEPVPLFSGTSNRLQHKIGYFGIEGDLPEEGTIIKIITYKPFQPGDRFVVTANAPDFSDKTAGKEKLDEISVFPNPYLGYNQLERGRDQKFMRFTGIPTEATLRIYTLAGLFVRKLDKNDFNQWLDWDLKNESGNFVASGIYLAHIEMYGIGQKILKLAVVMERQYLDRN